MRLPDNTPQKCAGLWDNYALGDLNINLILLIKYSGNFKFSSTLKSFSWFSMYKINFIDFEQIIIIIFLSFLIFSIWLYN